MSNPQQPTDQNPEQFQQMIIQNMQDVSFRKKIADWVLRRHEETYSDTLEQVNAAFAANPYSALISDHDVQLQQQDQQTQNVAEELGSMKIDDVTVADFAGTSYKCNICGMNFNHVNLLDIHERWHIQQQQQQNHPIAEFYASTGIMQNRQDVEVIAKNNIGSVTIDDQGFVELNVQPNDYNSLMQHSSSADMVICDICGLIFNHVNLLNMHKRVHS